MIPQLTAFRWVPPDVQGYVRDLRIRWAFEEAGLPYEAVLVDGAILGSADYRTWQPFGQVPAYADDEVELFESGAIVLHLAGKSAALAEPGSAGLARVGTWIIAALNSIEPYVQALIQVTVFHAGESWTVERRPQVEAALDARLASLTAWLGEKPYLEGRFTAGDILMACVLRELVDTGAYQRFPAIGAYVARCEARPAFQRAMAAQLADFAAHAPA